MPCLAARSNQSAAAVRSCGTPRPSTKRVAISYSAAGSPLTAAARRPPLPIAAGSLSLPAGRAGDCGGSGALSAGGVARALLSCRAGPAITRSPAAVASVVFGAVAFAAGRAGSLGSTTPAGGVPNGIVVAPGRIPDWRPAKGAVAGVAGERGRVVASLLPLDAAEGASLRGIDWVV